MNILNTEPIQKSEMHKDLIFDVGMNNGDDTAYYLHLGFRVVAIEANPLLVEQARERFSIEVSSGRLTILNIGIADTSGNAVFWVCEPHTEWGSFDRDIASRDGCAHYAIEISCFQFKDILKEYGVPYYLKVDIEGHDHLCISDLTQDNLPKYISVEANDASQLGQLNSLGYNKFKCISQFNYIPIETPSSKEEIASTKAEKFMASRNFAIKVWRKLGGRAIVNRRMLKLKSRNGWVFNFGSSGPFGDCTPGKWHSYENMLNVYQYYSSLKEQGHPSIFWNDKPYSFWADFHAKIDEHPGE